MPKTKDEMKQSSVTVMQSVVTGGVAGAVEVLVDHPLWSIKTRMQRGEPFTLNPKVLYRGIGPNAASMVPITAVQVGLDRAIQHAVCRDEKGLSPMQKVATAFVAGAGSALVSSPTEMVMTYQGKVGGSFYAAAQHLRKQAGWRCLLRGFPATAMRDGMFTAFLLGVTPMVKDKIKPYCKEDLVASITAGVVAGMGATAVSQGVDTLKTVQQAADPLKPMSFSEAVKNIYAKHGTYGFFKGAIPRGARVVSAVTIMSCVKEEMEARFWHK